MKKRRFSTLVGLVLLASTPLWGSGEGWANGGGNGGPHYKGKVTPAERKEAAKRAAKLGLLPGAASLLAQAPDPGGIPHYFGPYANWAYSPLPRGPITSVAVVDGGSGYSAEPTVTVEDVYGTGSGATATATVAGGVITGITFSGGADYSAPIVTITDPTGTGAAAEASIAAVPAGGPLSGGVRKFVDGMPGLTVEGANNLGQYLPVAVPQAVTFSGQQADYYEIAIVEYEQQMHSDLPPTRMRGYVQLSTAEVPGAQIPLFQVDGVTPVLLPNGQQARAVDPPHFLGPVVAAERDRPVRVKFYNLLPTGAGGDLFLPVDTTVMGAGQGPIPGHDYTQNRASIHLHGNNTVWISDGSPHQWFTPAGENTPYLVGVSARNVPDMPDPGPGAMTFFYTNAQSARFMFYHDHALGITRLNVYAGEAAGYLVTDPVEQDLIDGTNNTGVNPDRLQVLPDMGIPLIIADRTFVDETTIWAQDPTWNWGTTPPVPNTGDLWYPHVYMPAQNPWDLAGSNAFGRWHYGPWFIQPTPVCDAQGLPAGCIEEGPVPNEHCLPQPPSTCVVDGLTQPDAYDCSDTPGEPPCRPGTPNPSMPGEAFMDTPLVNGTAYPYLEVEPKAYRFRVLNAADDRFWNLQLYVAADKTTPTTPGTTGTVLCDGVSGALVENCTEVKMAPVSVAPANQYADWPSGIPDPDTRGPDWIQIGTEGGFLPAPVVVPQQPIGWNLNPTTFNFGTVNQHSLLLGSAERADVVVDFSDYAGMTLILYNDAPAAFPAGAPTYDFYTGGPNQMDTGGTPTTQPGYGPNTRTVMQIRVGTTVTAPTPEVTLENLQAVFAKTAGKRGVFEASQETILIPQKAYESAYGATTYPSTAAGQYVQIADKQKTFRPIDADGVLQAPVTLPLELKALHDEMGGVYDTMFGRMSGMLGVTSSLSSANQALIPYGYASPPVDIVAGSVSGSPIGVLPDGTQIWRLFHNGVDTHPIHTHLFNAQLLNRTGQDGAMLPPDPTELGWKETLRINPLEVTYIALRPTIPTQAQVPFPVPNSIRLIDPTLPEGAPLVPPAPGGWFDPAGNPIETIPNHLVNYGWEYVWHCHILAHEEMDMMHSLAFALPPATPTLLSAVVTGNGANRRVDLTWSAVQNATHFTVQRATNVSFTNNLVTVPLGDVTTYSDLVGNTSQTFYYRVIAQNVVGDTGTPGFPTKTIDSGFSNTLAYPTNAPLAAPAAPSNVVATAVQQGNTARVTLTWQDNSDNESGFRIQRALDAAFTSGVATSTVGANTTTTTQTVSRLTSYYYRVQAFNAADPSAFVNAAPFPIVTP